MTDQVPQESAQPVSDTTGSQTVTSGAESGQATSPDQGAELQERIDQLEAQIKGLQSVGDKREARFTENFKVVQDYLQRAGLQPDQNIIRDMQVDELLAGRSPQTGQPTQPVGNGPGSQTPPPSVDYLKVFEAVGVSPTDNEVIRLATKHADDPKALSAALVELKIQRGQQPPASAGGTPPAPGGVPAGTKPDISTISDPGVLYEVWTKEGGKVPPRRDG